VVGAFFAAARDGDFGALLAVLDPGVVLRIDADAKHPSASMAIQGADAVARQTLRGLKSALRVAQVRPALVNGNAGVIVTVRGRPLSVMGFTVVDGKIAEIDSIADPERIRRIAAGILTDD
jgi:RNA polymerase sigma-70 factor, ECF subfamily